jgi:hypothetical protein
MQARDGCDARQSRLPAGVSDDALRRAVAASRSWRGVLRELGLNASRQSRPLREACDRLGIDYGHLGGARFDDAAFVDVMRTATSWSDALALLGFAPGSGSARTTIRAHCLRLGLAVPSFAPRRPDRDAAFPGTPDLANLRHAGPYLVAAACELAGHRVSWPLEPAVYDLVVDTGDRLRRVQVKTSTHKAQGAWLCKVARAEYASGVSGGKRIVRYGADEIDCFGIVDGDLAVYLIPVDAVEGRARLTMRRYAEYRLPRPGQALGCDGQCRGDRT